MMAVLTCQSGVCAGVVFAAKKLGMINCMYKGQDSLTFSPRLG